MLLHVQIDGEVPFALFAVAWLRGWIEAMWRRQIYGTQNGSVPRVQLVGVALLLGDMIHETIMYDEMITM